MSEARAQRQIVIGDIHGCYDELLALLRLTEVTDDDLLVSVGDLVDRGPKSREVCDFFAERENALVLMGNHERKHIRGVRSYAQEIVRVQMGGDYETYVEAMKAFPYFVELDAAIVVHAAFEHDVPLTQQREDVLAGTTSGERHLESKYGGGYWTDAYDGCKPIIFGHHVVGDDVKIWNETRNNRVYGIDTGACHGGRLSALVLPEFRVVQVDVEVDHWAEQKRTWQAAVLADKPWATLTWDKIDAELTRAARGDGPGVDELIETVRRWLEELRGSAPAIAAASDAIVGRLLEEHGEHGFGRAAGRHPAKGWLFRHRRDPLNGAKVLATCTTPAALASAADATGVKVVPEPPIGSRR